MTPVLLVHGLFGSLSDPVLLDAFAQRPVLAPDLIGYGRRRDTAPAGWALADQADKLAGCLRREGGGPVHVVGHSVGGAIAVLLACRYPELVRSLTSVEGNFTLDDAFWSRKISTLPLPEIEAEVAGFRADIPGWLAGSGVAATPWTIATATGWLDNQPATTLRHQARAVVEATAAHAYLDGLRARLDAGLALHLLAGSRARAGWHVPDWVAARASSEAEMPGAGHLMMLEDPAGFARNVLAPLQD